LQVPVCISSTSIFTENPANQVLNWAAITLSVVGTLAVALEDFFQFGARARARHLCVAKLDRTFWSFHALAGPWDMYDQHSGEAYKTLTLKIEESVREAEVQNIATFAGMLIPHLPAAGSCQASLVQQLSLQICSKMLKFSSLR
jgi:hypothetical protein